MGAKGATITQLLLLIYLLHILVYCHGNIAIIFIDNFKYHYNIACLVSLFVGHRVFFSACLSPYTHKHLLASSASRWASEIFSHNSYVSIFNMHPI